MAEFEVYGTCYKCGGTDRPVFKYKGHWWDKWCLAVEKDSTKKKIEQLEKPVDDFNKLIRKCIS